MKARILLLAAAVWIVFNLPSIQARQAAAPKDPARIYNDVYNGWKWWHVYCYRCHGPYCQRDECEIQRDF